jgi:hypothetical protein
MSNNYSINAAGINGSVLSVVVGTLAAAVLAVTSTQTMANVIAGSSSTGTISTVVIAQANQIHSANCFSSVLPVTGSGTAVRMAGYIPKVDKLSTYGSTVNSFLRVYGGSSVELRTNGTVIPNYLVVPPDFVGGVLDTAIQIDSIRLKIGSFTKGFMSLVGYFVIPNIISVIDIYMGIQLDGYCIPANELGYGYGNLDVTIICEAVRIVPVKANMVLWGDGPQLITNDAGYYRGSGNVTTSGTVNVNIKASGTTYYTWYYENWLTLDGGTGSCEALIYKNMYTTGSIPKLNVVVIADGIRQATAILNPVEVKVTGIFDTEKRAGIIGRMGYLRTSNKYPFNYNVYKSPSSGATLSTTGIAEAVTRRLGSSTGNVTTSGDCVYWERITNANISSGVLSSVGSASSIRIVVLDNTIGSIVPNSKITCLVYKHVSCNGVIGITGALDSKIMFTIDVTNIGTGGFCIGERVHVSAPAAGTISLVVVNLDSRIAIRGEVVSIWNTTTNTGNDDFRLAIRYDETSYWNTLTSLSEDYRLAVRMSSHETLYTTCTLFDVVNLFVKADETRQMVVAPSPNRVGDIQNYIKVVV